MKVFFFTLFIAGFVFSCGNASEETQKPKNDASIIFGNSEFQLPPLSSPAKEQATHWGVLEDFLVEAKEINGSNFESLRIRSERMREYSDSLFKNIPDTLDTNPINSRLVVLKTRSEMLFQAAHRDAIDSLKLQNAVAEMNVAVTNFIIQLNEKFQKDNIDFLRKDNEDMELKKQQRARDSIFALEIQDKKNN